jgi:hypothetical protein
MPQQATSRTAPKPKSSPLPNGTKSHPEATREEALKATQARLREKRNRIDKEHTKIQDQEATSAFRTLLDSNQKLGNKLALGKHKPNPPVALRAVQTPEGRLATTAEEVIEATERWARNKMKAPEPNGKTGRYLPDEAPRHYPWETTELSDDGDPMADNLPTGPQGYGCTMPLMTKWHSIRA